MTKNSCTTTWPQLDLSSDVHPGKYTWDPCFALSFQGGHNCVKKRTTCTKINSLLRKSVRQNPAADFGHSSISNRITKTLAWTRIAWPQKVLSRHSTSQIHGTKKKPPKIESALAKTHTGRQVDTGCARTATHP